ncbi:MAG: TorF family putative porin [Sphingomonas sp.]|jgi:uncharacterized protein (TIGR02001 family)|uniref:TorF family putative porin n=1 Tax=Sphingomonas sp. TaxID=28214 RepID=UPI003565F60C
MTKIYQAIAVALAILATPAVAQDANSANSGPPATVPVKDASGMKLSASLSAATDYMFRGVSQTDVKPAVFAAVNAKWNGFYAGAGTENVDFLGTNQEYDFWGGYVLPIGKASLDVGVVRYGYIDSTVNIDTVELKAALSGSLGKTALGVAAYYTPNYFGSHQHAVYAEATASYALTDKFSVSGALGRQQIDNIPDYTTWNLGVSYKVLKGATIDLRYHDTDTSAFGRLGRARVVGSFSVNF